MSPLETMRLGQTEHCISRLGMGCWAIGGHGWGYVKDEDSIRAVRCALENGVTLFDTADVYGLGKSETLLAEVLGSSRTRVVVASKGGVRWNECGKVWPDISPSYLRSAVEESLRRLKLDCIPLYYIHKPDRITPIQESIAALVRLHEEGKIGAIGVANVSAGQLVQALQVSSIAAVQVRLNMVDRGAAKDLLNICRERGITLVAWGALADGLLTGKFASNTRFSSNDHRSRMSEFKGDAFLEYIRCMESLNQLAGSMGRKASQIALRWVLDYASFTCSLFGAKTDIQVLENLAADGWSLTKEKIALIDSIAGKCAAAMSKSA